MKKKRLVICLGATLGLTVAAGCGDDSPGTDSGNDSGTGAESSSGGEVTPPASSSGADSSSGGGEMGMDDTSTGSAPVEVTVEGEVADLVPPSLPIPDAVIGVYGDDTLTATSNAGGLYSIGPFAPDMWATMVLEPSTEYQGSVIAVNIGNAPEQEDQLAQIGRATIVDQIDGLESQMPADVDLSQAIIIVRLITPFVINEGGPVRVTMDPPPVPDTYYAPDASFAPVLNSSELAFAGLPVVVYFNVVPDEPGAYSFTFEHDTSICTSVYDELPTLGDHVTLINVTCE